MKEEYKPLTTDKTGILDIDNITERVLSAREGLKEDDYIYIGEILMYLERLKPLPKFQEDIIDKIIYRLVKIKKNKNKWFNIGAGEKKR